MITFHNNSYLFDILDPYEESHYQIHPNTLQEELHCRRLYCAIQEQERRREQERYELILAEAMRRHHMENRRRAVEEKRQIQAHLIENALERQRLSTILERNETRKQIRLQKQMEEARRSRNQMSWFRGQTMPSIYNVIDGDGGQELYVMKPNNSFKSRGVSIPVERDEGCTTRMNTSACSVIPPVHDSSPMKKADTSIHKKTSFHPNDVNSTPKHPPLKKSPEVEDASDSECEDEFHDYFHNRRPRAGEWIEPVIMEHNP